MTTIASTLSLVKPGQTAPTKTPLPTRNHRPYMTDAQGFATLASRLAGITTPHIRDWTDTGHHNAARPFADGTLTYHHTPRTLTWTAPCPQGISHSYALQAPGDFQTANQHLGSCTSRHTPTPPLVRSLAQAFGHDSNRATSDDADKTQPMSRAEITAGLNTRAAEQPKEHPQP